MREWFYSILCCIRVNARKMPCMRVYAAHPHEVCTISAYRARFFDTVHDLSRLCTTTRERSPLSHHRNRAISTIMDKSIRGESCTLADNRAHFLRFMHTTRCIPHASHCTLQLHVEIRAYSRRTVHTRPSASHSPTSSTPIASFIPATSSALARQPCTLRDNRAHSFTSRAHPLRAPRPLPHPLTPTTAEPRETLGVKRLHALG